MHSMELAYRIGRAETAAYSAHARLDDHGRVLMTILRHQGKRGHRLGIWVQIIGIVVTSAASIFGITLPEKFLHILEMLGRALH